MADFRFGSMNVKRGLWLTIGLATAWLTTSVAVAQERPDRPRRPRDGVREKRDGAETRGDAERRRGPERPFDRGPRGERGPRGGDFDRPHPPMAARLLRPSPEDEGPLAEGEAETLMAFAAEYMPELHERLSRAQSDRPEAFERRFQFFAPRLRHFRRVQEQRPELFDALLEHSRLMLRMERFRGEWRRVDSPPAERRFRQRVREFIAEKFDLETRFVEADVTARRARSDAFIDALVERALTSERAERLPPELREAVADYADADETRQEEIRATLRAFVAERFEEELSQDEAHLQRRRENAPRFVDGELDRMMARFRHERDGGPPPFAAPPPPP